jgi:hypothetical protein
MTASTATDTAHGLWGGSVVARRLACPASAKLESQAPPSKPSTASRRGTKLHEIAANLIEGKPISENPEPEVIAEAMAQYGALVARFRPQKVLTEIKVEVPGVDSGTADLVMVCHDSIVVADFKFGRFPVDVTGNAQLRFYATGAVLSNYKPTVHLAIIQPGRTLATETIETKALLEWWKVLRDHKERVEADPNPKPLAGKHCSFCRAMVTCPAYNGVRLGDMLKPIPKEPSGAELSTLLETAEHAERWAKSVRALAVQRATEGTEIPKYMLVNKFGPLVWKPGAVEWFKERNLPMTRSAPLTPTQALKLYGAGIEEISERLEKDPELWKVG